MIVVDNWIMKCTYLDFNHTNCISNQKALTMLLDAYSSTQRHLYWYANLILKNCLKRTAITFSGQPITFYWNKYNQLMLQIKCECACLCEWVCGCVCTCFTLLEEIRWLHSYVILSSTQTSSFLLCQSFANTCSLFCFKLFVAQDL